MALRRRKDERGSDLFPGFTDVGEIGVGSLATVYRAREAGTSRLVALKLLNVRDASPRAIESFERESVALGSLSSHPNIVTLYRTFRTPDGRPVLVLELCTGAVADRLRGGAGLQVPDAVAIGIKVAGALETAHRGGILHRDVKPQNILVTEFGEPALADFGVAMLQSSTQTTAGLFDFTTLHAAPELLEGAGTSAATDVYELASTLYQLIAGQSAFRAYEGESPASVILRILRDPVRPLSGTEVPVQLSDLLIRAMSKDMQARPPTAAEFAAELADVEIAQGWPRTQFLIRGAAEAGVPGIVTRMPDAVPRGMPSPLGVIDPLPVAPPPAVYPIPPVAPPEPEPVVEPVVVAQPEPVPVPVPVPVPEPEPEPVVAAVPDAEPESEPRPELQPDLPAEPVVAAAEREPDVVVPAVPQPVELVVEPEPALETRPELEPEPVGGDVPDGAPITVADTVSDVVTDGPAVEPLPPVAADSMVQAAPADGWAPLPESPSLLEQLIAPAPTSDQQPAGLPAEPSRPVPDEPEPTIEPPPFDPPAEPEPVIRRDPSLASWWAPLGSTERPGEPEPPPVAPAPAAEPVPAQFPAPPATAAVPGTAPATGVPVWATRTPTATAPAYTGDLVIDPSSLRPRYTVRAGFARLTADDSQLVVRRMFGKERLPWSQVTRFEQHFPEGEPDGRQPGVLLAITPSGAIELPATRRPPADLRTLHAMLDAYRVRAQTRANR